MNVVGTREQDAKKGQNGQQKQILRTNQVEQKLEKKEKEKGFLIREIKRF